MDDVEPDEGPTGPRPRLEHGVRRAVRSDATAFGYSILITAVFGAAVLEAPPATGLRIFGFVLGATSGFALWEAAVTRGFRVRVREERSEVLLVGTSLAPLAVSLGLGAAYGLLVVSRDGWAWVLAPLAATTAYVLATGTQLAMARRWAENQPADDQE